MPRLSDVLELAAAAPAGVKNWGLLIVDFELRIFDLSCGMSK